MGQESNSIDDFYKYYLNIGKFFNLNESINKSINLTEYKIKRL